MKKALITGITGQDGSYLAELLIEKGYEVHGITRRTSASNTTRIDHLLVDHSITLHNGDMTDGVSLVKIKRKSDQAFTCGMYMAESVIKNESADIR